MSRVYNFSAGPSCLPEEVLNECAAESQTAMLTAAAENVEFNAKYGE